MWRIDERDDGFYVVDPDGNDHSGPHASRAEAMDAMRAAMAEDSDGEEASTDGRTFTTLLAIEGLATSDRRYFEVGSLTWRNLPLPLMLQDTLPEFGGHAGAWFAGSIERIERDPAEPTRIMGYGRLAGPRAGEAAEAIEGGLRGVSVDVMAVSGVLFDVRATDDDGYPTDWLERYDGGELGGATVTPHPAFADATIWLDGMDAPTFVAEVAGEHVEPAPEWQPPEAEGLLLLAAGAPRPPRDAFFAAEPDEPTPLTVTDDGRIFGHLATWGSCHTSFAGRCVTPPPSPTDYSYFHLGEVVADDGTAVAVGQITMDTGHAAVTADVDARAALAHYDNTGTAVADVRVVNGVHGPWACGVLRGHVDEDTVGRLRAAKWSGDWRPINGAAELVAVLTVNVPGFPIPRPQARLVASGAVATLIAAPSPGDPADCVECDDEPAVDVPPVAASTAEVAALAAEVGLLRRTIETAFAEQFQAKAAELRARL